MNLLKSMHDFDRVNVEMYGKVFGYVLNGMPCLLVEDLDMLKEILIKNFESFPDRPDFGEFNESDLRASFLIIKKGDDWRRIRNNITPAFTSGKMKRLIPVMKLCCNEFVEYLEKYAKDGSDIPLKE